MREITSFSDYLKELPNLISNKNETVFVTSKGISVLKGADNLNEEYCKNNNLNIYKTHQFGGTIINFENDLCVANYQPAHNDFGIRIMKGIKDYLTSKGIHSIINNNDVLIDGEYKVASYMSTYINNCLYTAIHISIDMNLEIIQNVCTKPMNKIPKGLSEYGITQQEIKDLIIRVCENV